MFLAGIWQGGKALAVPAHGVALGQPVTKALRHGFIVNVLGPIAVEVGNQLFGECEVGAAPVEGEVEHCLAPQAAVVHGYRAINAEQVIAAKFREAEVGAGVAMEAKFGCCFECAGV